MLCKHRLSLTALLSLTYWQCTFLVWFPWPQCTEHCRQKKQNFYDNNYIILVLRTLLQSDVVHLWMHISPVHFLVSLGFVELQLFASISIPCAFIQVTFLVLVPFPQAEEHWMFNRNIICIKATKNLQHSMVLYASDCSNGGNCMVLVVLASC